MDDTMKELERIQNELLAEESVSAEEDIIGDILSDEELNALLYEETEPAFDNPETIHDPDGEMVYNNFANDYGNEDIQIREETKKKEDKVIIGLMIGACALCLGIIGLLGYWMAVIL